MTGPTACTVRCAPDFGVAMRVLNLFAQRDLCPAAIAMELERDAYLLQIAFEGDCRDAAPAIIAKIEAMPLVMSVALQDVALQDRAVGVRQVA